MLSLSEVLAAVLFSSSEAAVAFLLSSFLSSGISTSVVVAGYGYSAVAASTASLLD